MKQLICIFVGLFFYLPNIFAQIPDDYSIIYYQKPENPKSPLGALSVALNRDHTYLYRHEAGGWWFSENSFGYWSTDSKRKELILKSMIPSADSIPLIVQEKQNGNNVIQLVFGTTFNDSTEWSIVLNGREYSIIPDSIISIEGTNKVDSFFVQGYKDFTRMLPPPKQENIRSITYYPREESDFYQISFPNSIDYDIFHFVPLQDTLKIRRNNLFWTRKEWNKTIKLDKLKLSQTKE